MVTWRTAVSNSWLTESPDDGVFPTVEKVIQLNAWSGRDIFGK